MAARGSAYVCYIISYLVQWGVQGGVSYLRLMGVVAARSNVRGYSTCGMGCGHKAERYTR